MSRVEIFLYGLICYVVLLGVLVYASYSTHGGRLRRTSRADLARGEDHVPE
jgi:hypothetical protein